MIDDVKRYEPFWGEWYVTRELGVGNYGESYLLEKSEYGHVQQAVLKYIKLPFSQNEVKERMEKGMSEKGAEVFYRGVTEDLLASIINISKIDDGRIMPYIDRKVNKLDDKLQWDVFLKMEKLKNLDEFVRDNGITDVQALRIISRLCNLLETCARFEVIHADIKPENILINEAGEVFLSDFGITPPINRTLGVRKRGNMLYMAPEIFEGQPYTATVDTYALGLVLYKLFNRNREPFMPDFPEPIDQNDIEVSRVRRLRGDEFETPANAKGRVAEIILKAISYREGKRYKSPVIMRIELDNVISQIKEETLLIAPTERIVSTEEMTEIVPDFSYNEPTVEVSEYEYDNESVSEADSEDYDELMPESFDELVPDDGEEELLSEDVSEEEPWEDEAEPWTDESEYVDEYDEAAPLEVPDDPWEERETEKWEAKVAADPWDSGAPEETLAEEVEVFTVMEEQPADAAIISDESNESLLESFNNAPVQEKPKGIRSAFSIFSRKKDDEYSHEPTPEEKVSSGNIWAERYGSMEKNNEKKNSDPFGGGFKMGW